MTRERWLLPDKDTDTIDWRQAARELAIDLDTALALYEHAMHVALGHPQLGETLYRRALHAAASAAAPSATERGVGRLTRVMYEASPGKYRTAAELAAAPPGTWTRVEIETTRDAATLPGYDDVQAAMRSLLGTAPPAESAAMPPATSGPRGVGAPESPAVARPSGGWRPPPPVYSARDGAIAPAPARPAALLLRSRAEGAEQATVDHPAVAAALARRGGGQLLPEALRHEMEAMLGADLGGVRVHTDAAAAVAAKAIGARAFTVGHDIFFARGAFDPRSLAGRELLAHELTHVVQLQRGGVAEPAAGHTRVSDPSEPMEQEAEQVARQIAARSPAHTEPPGAPQPAGRAAWSRPRAQPPAMRSAGVLLRAPDPVEEGPLRIPPGGLPVEELGIVAWAGQPPLRLRSAPTTAENNILATLPFNTRVEVVQRFAGNWLLVTTRDGTTGFCAEQHVWYPPDHAPPEPDARLHRVEHGDKATAIQIARRYYGDVADKRGADLRFYVAALGAVNHVVIPDASDGWKTVRFEPSDIIWIPSVAFARSLHGTLDAGSRGQRSARAVGLDGVIERSGQLMRDLEDAIRSSGRYVPAAVARHVEPGVAPLVESLMAMATDAVAVPQIASALEATIAARDPDPRTALDVAPGFAVGAALAESLGAGFLVAWADDAADRLGTAFGAVFRAVWNAEGNPAALDRAAIAFAEAIGTLGGALIEALATWASTVGVDAAVAELHSTAIGRTIGPGQLAAWIEERIADHQAGVTALPGRTSAM